MFISIFHREAGPYNYGPNFFGKIACIDCQWGQNFID